MASAQQKNRKPLILQGRISNSPEKFLKISLFDENNSVQFDTLHLNDKGEFYLKTFKITRPQRTNLWQNRTYIGQIYVAPGYELQITADATSFFTSLTSKKITGIGEESNRYRVQWDTTKAAAADKRPWYERKPEEVVPYLKFQRRLDDSIYHKVFARSQPKDPYFNFFKKIIEIDNQSQSFAILLQFSMVNNYNKAEMEDLIHNNIPPLFANKISNDDYLISQEYTEWIVPLYYEYKKAG